LPVRIDAQHKQKMKSNDTQEEEDDNDDNNNNNDDDDDDDGSIQKAVASLPLV
jgi:hypothetical protein